MPKFHTYSLSIKGRRETNQDMCLIFKPREDALFLAVADGMGGVAGGQIASQTVIECCKNILLDFFKSDVKPSQLKEILIHIFNQAQKSVKIKVEEDPKLNGMGTTLACVLILNDKYVWGNIGDSRIYQISNSKISQITSDHTHIQDFLNQHNVKISDKMLSNYGHYLTRSIDGGTDEADILPDVVPYEELKEGDTFLLCSDGLITNKMEKDEENILKYLSGTKNLEEAAENLIGRAFANGSNDNISIVLCEYGSVKRKRIKLNYYKLPNDEKINSNFIHKNKTKIITGAIIIISILTIISFYMGLWKL